jgi:hypothetical protein
MKLLDIFISLRYRGENFGGLMKQLAILCFALCLVPTLALAQTTPDGCYVTYDNPSQCYGQSLQTLYNTQAENISHYGLTTGVAASDLHDCFDNVASGNAAYNALSADRNNLKANYDACAVGLAQYQAGYQSCASTFSSVLGQRDGCVQSYNLAVASNQAYAGLVARLRSACGSRCRSIK